MAILKFKGAVEHRVPKPGTYFIGQRPQYLGLAYTESGELEPVEFTVDDATAEGQRIVKLARRDGCFVAVTDAAPGKKQVTANG